MGFCREESRVELAGYCHWIELFQLKSKKLLLDNFTFTPIFSIAQQYVNNNNFKIFTLKVQDNRL